MARRRCEYLKRGVLWLMFWIVLTLFVYFRNASHLFQNVETKHVQFSWLESTKQEGKTTISPHERTSVLNKQNTKQEGKTTISPHERTSVLSKQNTKQEGKTTISPHERTSVLSKQNTKQEGKTTISPHERTSVLSKQRMSFPAQNNRNITYEDSYQNVTYKTIFRTQNKSGITHEKLSDKNINEKLILFYNPCNFQTARNLTNISYTFENCEVKNCRVTFNQSDANISDAVIFHWFKQLKSYPDFNRPRNQVWIFIQHENTRSYANRTKKFNWFKIGMRNNFNWTMTYSKYSDIHLPYGKMITKSDRPNRDYLKIAKSKTKDAMWVVSHCPTIGRREDYVNILKKYIDVEILGACGRNWTCGVRSNHALGDCFSVLNKTYRYYLAFENDLCEDYMTEKFYDNYKYDLLQVVRAGHPLKRPVNIDKEAYINTKDFTNAHELGVYLSKLSKNVTQYAKMLAKKDKYEVINYEELFKDSMCSICKRLNNLEEYRYVYDDVYEWMRKRQPCYGATDLG